MKYRHFSIEERESLQYMWWERKSIRSMAKTLNRSPSSVSRELKRNFSLEHRRYTPRLAHQRALAKRKSRGRHDRLKNDSVRQYVISRLKEGWSPEQISGRMKREGIGSISHEAVYQFVYARVGKCGLVKQGYEDLRPYLRRKRRGRTMRGFRRIQRLSARFGIPAINDRPTVVNSRSRIGDWESDTVESRDHRPGINTLVERKTGLVCMTKLSDKTSNATTAIIARRLKSLPCHTVTFDNGPENKDWKNIEADLSARCYFANPYHLNEAPMKIPMASFGNISQRKQILL